jgi:peptidase YpeB-like protein
MRKWVIAGIVGLVAAGTITGGAIAFASGNDDEGTVTGRQADQAIAAALAATGGGTANAVERDGENGATWEVEVSTPDGRLVDVRLDADFSVVAVEGDSESADTSDASGN